MRKVGRLQAAIAKCRRTIIFVRTHRLKPKYRWLFTGFLALLVVVGLAVRGHLSQPKRPSAPVPSNTPTSVNINNPAEMHRVHGQLRRYLARITNGDQVSVTFYNLAPAAGSQAAHEVGDGLNQPGALAVATHGDTPHNAVGMDRLYTAAFLLHTHASKGTSWLPEEKAGFDAMMIDNSATLANATLTTYGKVQVNDYLATLHVKPVFSYVAPSETTTNDLITVLQRLANRGEPFTQPKARRWLLKDMQRQVFRGGIPAAVNNLLPKATVQNVVGYHNYSNSDAAIVTTAAGQRFVLAIMTEGQMQQDLTPIAEIAHKIIQIAYFRG